MKKQTHTLGCTARPNFSQIINLKKTPIVHEQQRSPVYWLSVMDDTQQILTGTAATPLTAVMKGKLTIRGKLFVCHQPVNMIFNAIKFLSDLASNGT